jgi:hypothetical protein
VVLLSATGGCSLGPIGAATPSPTSTPAPVAPAGGIPATDLDGPRKVVEALFPDGGTACGESGDYRACPVTDALRSRLANKPVAYADQLCRCSKPYAARAFSTTTTADGAVVRVDLTIESAKQSLDVSMDRSLGVWLAADLTCAGRGTSTSLFSDAPSLCYAPSGS